MKKLNWGETPWDDMSREELLREVQRLYSAADAAHVTIRSLARNEIWLRFGEVLQRDGKDDLGERISELLEQDRYWGKGAGARVLSKLQQATAVAVDPESLYHSFYRYADDLLFADQKELGIGRRWAICPDCGVMLGNGGAKVGKSCSFLGAGETDCQGFFRWLTWDDLRPL